MKKILWWAVFILSIAVAVCVYILTKRGKSAKVEELRAEKKREELELEDELAQISALDEKRRAKAKQAYLKKATELDKQIEEATMSEDATATDIAKGWADYAAGGRS